MEKFKMFQKILGISAICVGLTRVILVIDKLGILNSFQDLSYYIYLGIFVFGILSYIAGE